MKLLFRATLLAFFYCAIAQAKHSPPTFLHRTNSDGTLLASQGKHLDIHLDRPFKVAKTSNAVISISPQHATNGQLGIVTWEGISNPTENDWIGVYSPETSTDDDYLDFYPVNITSSDWMKGRGSFNLTLFNMRSGYQFRYFQVVGSANIRTANSQVVVFPQDEPMHGHLALTGNPTEIRVLWTSELNGTAVVRIGISRDHLNLTFIGVSKSYTADMMCESPANITSPRYFRNPGFMKDVLVTNLEPGVTYYYTFGSFSVQSQVAHFVGPRPVGPKEGFKMIVFGDMGTDFRPYFWESPGSIAHTKSMQREVLNNNVELLLHIGDLAYGVGHQYIWDQWGTLLQDYAVYAPVMICVGNHEFDYYNNSANDPSGSDGGFHPSWGDWGADSFGECGVATNARFHMPENGNKIFWYSFDHGNAHIVMMSSEHNFTEGSTQYNWLINDLKNVNRNLTPWLFVASHRPMYTSQLNEEDDHTVSLYMRQYLETVLMQYRVNVYFGAHYHSYERTCSVFNAECKPSGSATMHILTGGAGAGLEKSGYALETWSEARGNVYGYTRITTTDSQLTIEYILSEDDSVYDVTTIPLWQ